MDIPFFSLSLPSLLSFFFFFFYPLVFPFSSRPRLFFFSSSFLYFRSRVYDSGGGETNGESKNAGTKGGQRRNTRDSFELTVGMRLARFASLVN